MSSKASSIYDRVKQLLTGKFRSQYSKVKAAMKKAHERNDPDMYHKHKTELQMLRERVIRMINESERKQAPSGNSNTANKRNNKINALKEEYIVIKKAQEEARLSGNILEYGNLRAKVNMIKDQIVKEKQTNNTANNNQQQNLMNSSEENRIALSGSEPVYTPRLWNTRKGKGNNNCYSYAMNNFSADRPVKAVPGDRSGYNHDLDYKTCKNIQQRLLNDNPDSIYPEKPGNACIQGFSKIMMFVGERDTNAAYGDFHFYKHHKDIDYEVQPNDTIESISRFFQTTMETVMKANSNRADLKPGKVLKLKNFTTKEGHTLWSHKLGWATGALLTDACGKVITDPRQSCRKFSTIDYTKYCGTYCIRNAIAKSS